MADGSQVVRWGIVGCGDVTEVKSGPGLRKAAGSALVAVMRRDGAKAADYARRHGVPRWYDDAARLIADPEVDVVYVATPPGSHEQYALMACAAGKPCYVEKPMARSGAEAVRMRDAFAVKGLPLFVAYYRRGQPRFEAAREVLRSGRLGELRSVTYRFACPGMIGTPGGEVPWRLNKEESGGGLFLDLGSHALDAMEFFVGPLTVTSASAVRTTNPYGLEDTVHLSFRAAEGGVEGRADWDFVSREPVDEYCFTGTRGQMRMSCFGSEALRLTGSDGTTEAIECPHPQHVQQPLIQEIVDYLRGDRSGPMPASADAAVRTQLVMDAALATFAG